MATADPSAPASSGLSPKEEGELEDGEISDDDNNSQIRSRSSSTSSSGGGGLLPYPRRRPPHPPRGGGSGGGGGGGGGGGSSSSSSSSQQPLRNFSRSRHPSERGHLRGPSSYRPKEPFRTHPPPVRMPPGSLSESSPRPSFWERSHLALDRFRFRGRPYRGGSRWSRGRGVGERGGKPGCRPPLGGGAGSGFGSSQSWREPSPPRKSCILNVAVCPGCVAGAPVGVTARSLSFNFSEPRICLCVRRQLSCATHSTAVFSDCFIIGWTALEHERVMDSGQLGESSTIWVFNGITAAQISLAFGFFLLAPVFRVLWGIHLGY